MFNMFNKIFSICITKGITKEVGIVLCALCVGALAGAQISDKEEPDDNI